VAKLRDEIIQMTREIAIENLRLCKWLEKKRWRNKKIMKGIRALREATVDFYNNETTHQFPNRFRQKIRWKDLRFIDEKEYRNTTPVGHLRWREKGFRKQDI